MRRFALILGFVLLASPGYAQTINPTRILFDSPSHAVACPADGCILSYRVEVWGATVDPTTGAPISSATLDKTKVVASGTTPAYRALFSDLTPLLAYPAGQTVVIRMMAIGSPLSSDRSAPSNPFVKATAPATPSAIAVQ